MATLNPVARIPDGPADRWALFLDLDGTLVDIARSPAAVEVPGDLSHMLEKLRIALGGALALVTGRSIEQVDHLLGIPGLPVAGQHGAEIRYEDGQVDRAVVPADDFRQLVREVQSSVADIPGVIIEDKGLSLAIHFRQVPGAAHEILTRLEKACRSHCSAFVILPGHMVFEVKPRTVDKGVAVRRLMERPPFRGRVPIFVGDDRTDEDGCDAVTELGGHAVRVGRDPGGDYWIPTPTEVRRWLSRLMPAVAKGE